MRIGVPTEIKAQEGRVGLTPAGVRELVARGDQVLVQSGAGFGSSIGDAEYAVQGAIVVATAGEVFAGAEMIVKVKEPHAEESGCSARTTSSTPTCTSPPSPRSRPACARRRDVHRLRDRRGRARRAAAARPDERGRGPARRPGGRVHAREPGRRRAAS